MKANMGNSKIRRSDGRAAFLADIVTTAVEGGINHWASVSEYRWWSPVLDGGTAEHDGEQSNAYATLVHAPVEVVTGEEPRQVGGVYVVQSSVGVDDVERALGALRGDLDNELVDERVRAHMLECDRENDASELDAGACAALVQIAAFGAVVFS